MDTEEILFVCVRKQTMLYDTSDKKYMIFLWLISRILLTWLQLIPKKIFKLDITKNDVEFSTLLALSKKKLSHSFSF